ncbi:hypothetical protein AB0F15_14530, partial [Amycolatopsis sp. NPDC026612]|uniref:WXG100 family type VII secretion target n=1 Tax=Amycolatopsis sp. NPDC026612 TaxID=3155466 RepID=UPI0033DA8AE6
MGDLGAHIDSTDQSLDELGKIVADLASLWVGAGHDAFHEAITEWLEHVSCGEFAEFLVAGKAGSEDEEGEEVFGFA